MLTNQLGALTRNATKSQEIFDRCVRPKLRPEDEGKFVAVDLDSGAFEIDADDYLATGRMMTRLPNAGIWLLRAGHPVTYRV